MYDKTSNCMIKQKQFYDLWGGEVFIFLIDLQQKFK